MQVGKALLLGSAGIWMPPATPVLWMNSLLTGDVAALGNWYDRSTQGVTYVLEDEAIVHRGWGLECWNDVDGAGGGSSWDVLHDTYAHTICFWVRPTSIGTEYSPFWKHDNQFNVQKLGSNFLYYQWTDAGSANSEIFSITYDEWQHVAIVRDGATLTTYKNNVKIQDGIAFGANSPLRDAESSTLRLMLNDSSPTTYYIRGNMDNVIVFAEALGDTDIDDIYTNEPGTKKNLDTDLEGWWYSKDDVSGSSSWADQSGNSRPLTTSPNATVTAGTGLVLNGTDAYASRGATDFIGGSYAVTIMFWIKVTGALVTEDSPIRMNGQWNIQHYDLTYPYDRHAIWLTTGREDKYYSPAPEYPDIFWNDSTWHHYAFVAEMPGKLKTYIDGYLFYTSHDTFSSNPIQGSTVSLAVGGSGDSQFIQGYMDDVRIYSRALSAREAHYLYKYSPGSHA